MADPIEVARALAKTFGERAPAHDAEASFPFENFVDLHEAGLLKLTLPRAVGGGGASLYEFCAVQREIAQGCGATALALNMHLYNCGGALTNMTEGFRQRVMEDVFLEGAIMGSSLSEPTASLLSPTVMARKVAGGYRVTGRKYFCTLAPILRYFLFNAKLADYERPGVSGTVTLAAKSGSPGMRIVETWDAMGMRATGSHDIEFQETFIADECLLGPEGEGTESGLAALPWYALGIASVYLGIAAAALRFAVDYAKQRTLHPSPRSIAHLPGIQFTVAQMSIKLEAACAWVENVARDISNGSDFGDQTLPKVGGPQYFATNTALEVVQQAMQAVGGPSLFKRYPLERYYRDVRAGTLHPFAHYWLLEMIGKSALGIPLDVEPRWG